ncbi:MAG: isochorismatase family protein [Candidatus Limnocylindria bacterium]
MTAFGPDTALLVVDVQNDFADPGGSLAVRGGEEIVPRLNQEVQRAVSAGALVVYTQDWHPASTPHFAKDGGIWPVHCVAGTWGAELHPGLVVAGERIRKGSNGEDGYSAFTMRDPLSGREVPTELEAMLRQRGIVSVVVGGLATDYCVRSTVLDARRLGYPVRVLGSAIAAVDLQPDDGERALAELAAAGAEIEAG